MKIKKQIRSEKNKPCLFFWIIKKRKKINFNKKEANSYAPSFVMHVAKNILIRHRNLFYGAKLPERLKFTLRVDKLNNKSFRFQILWFQVSNIKDLLLFSLIVTFSHNILIITVKMMRFQLLSFISLSCWLCILILFISVKFSEFLWGSGSRFILTSIFLFIIFNHYLGLLRLSTVGHCIRFFKHFRHAE